MNLTDQRCCIAFGRLRKTTKPTHIGFKNPKPAGMVQRGGSNLVFMYLAERQGRAFTAGQIETFLGLNRPEVSGGPYYPSRQDPIKTLSDPRSPSYLRYVQKAELTKFESLAEDRE